MYTYVYSRYGTLTLVSVCITQVKADIWARWVPVPTVTLYLPMQTKNSVIRYLGTVSSVVHPDQTRILQTPNRMEVGRMQYASGMEVVNCILTDSLVG